MTAADELPGVCPDCYEDDCCGDCWCCDLRECAWCGDLVDYLSSDDLCDGCLAEEASAVAAPPPTVTVQPAARFL